MPKSTPLIPTDFVLRELDTLAGSIRIIPEQVSVIIGIPTSKLEDLRYKGKLPFVKEGGKILYRVEDVRNYLQTQRAPV
jgi:hypothetical protein